MEKLTDEKIMQMLLDGVVMIDQDDDKVKLDHGFLKYFNKNKKQWFRLELIDDLRSIQTKCVTLTTLQDELDLANAYIASQQAEVADYKRLMEGAFAETAAADENLKVVNKEIRSANRFVQKLLIVSFVELMAIMMMAGYIFIGALV